MPRSRPPTAPRLLRPVLSRSSVRRCVLVVLAALLALPAAALGADHRGGTFLALATGNAGTADPQVNATSQYWHLYQVTHDGLTAFRKAAGPAANSVVPDLATRLPRTTDGGRTWTLTLRRGVRYSNGAQVQPADVRFTFERLFKVHGPTAESLYGAIDGADRLPAEPGDLHARPRRGAERPHDHVPPHAARQRVAAEARAAARGAAAAEHGRRGDRHGRLAPRRHRPVLLGVVRAGAPARAAPQPVLQGLGAGRAAGRLRRSHRAALRAGRRGRGHARSSAGRPTGSSTTLPPDRLPELLRRYASQLHDNQLPADLVRRAQRQHQAVRRARGAAGRQPRDRPRTRSSSSSAGRSSRRRPARCSRPASPGYAPYCPWTLGGSAPWSGPDLARAQQLVDESGTAGARVDIVVANDAVQKAIGKYIQVVLFKLGFDPRVKALPDGVQSAFVQNSRNRVEAGPRAVAAGVPGALRAARRPARLRLLRAGLRREPEHQRLLRPHDGAAADAARASISASTRPRAAERLWRQVDRRVTDLAVWLPLFNPKRLDLVSKRVGNYRWSPQLHLMPRGSGCDRWRRERRGTRRGPARRADRAAPRHGALDERQRRRAAVHAAARRADGRPARGAQGAQARRRRAPRSPTSSRWPAPARCASTRASTRASPTTA